MTPNRVLVTGSHRSGTTWIAKVLSHSRRVAFVDEPFNPIYRPSRVDPVFKLWFQYVCDENAGEFVDRLTRAYELHYPWRQLVRLRSRDEWGRFGSEGVSSVFHRLLQDQVLCKDPIAIFSLPWLVEHFGLKVIVCVRHPAAFVSSNLKLGWEFEYRNLVNQPLFMRDCAGDFAAEIERMASDQAPPIEQETLLWRIIYSRVHDYQARYPDWIVIRHEDMVDEPRSHFSDLARRCGLPWDASLADFADRSSSSENPGEVPSERWNTVFRDSRAAARTWHSRLAPEQIDQIREATQREASWFYSESDWVAS